MIIIKALQDIYNSTVNSIKQIVSCAIIKNNNPTCVFYPGVKIGKSTFQRYNVIFDNVTIYASNIGAHTYIQKNSKIFNTKIGNFCSIASNVSIAPGMHKTTGVSTHPSFYLKDTPLAISFSNIDFFEPSCEVIIGHDVWIGENVIILDGITIGTGAIIAAGSVVTKNIEPYSIVGGVPAKILKYRFSSDQISELLKSEWWDLPDTWFIKNFKKMHNINDFLAKKKSKWD